MNLLNGIGLSAKKFISISLALVANHRNGLEGITISISTKEDKDGVVPSFLFVSTLFIHKFNFYSNV